MAKKLKHHHIFHFILLMILLALGGSTIIALRYHIREQILTTLGIGAFYVIWGIMHHDRENDLHPKIVAEYIAMALLGCVILISVIVKL